MTGVHSGIQWNIYVKPFNIPPSPFLIPPSPFTGLIWALKTEGKLKRRISQNDQIDRSPNLAHDIFAGFQPNVVKFLALVKDTIISEVNLQNF